MVVFLVVYNMYQHICCVISCFYIIVANGEYRIFICSRYRLLQGKNTILWNCDLIVILIIKMVGVLLPPTFVQWSVTLLLCNRATLLYIPMATHVLELMASLSGSLKSSYHYPTEIPRHSLLTHWLNVHYFGLNLII